MKSIIDKHWNGYRFTYMGEHTLCIQGQTIEPTVPFVVPTGLVAIILNNLSAEERDNIIYEKIIISNHIMGDVITNDQYN